MAHQKIGMLPRQPWVQQLTCTNHVSHWEATAMLGTVLGVATAVLDWGMAIWRRGVGRRERG